MDYNGYLVYGVDLGGDDLEDISEAVQQDTCPAELVGYGMDGTGTIVALANSLQNAAIHCAEPVDLALDADDVTAFAAWCAEHGLSEPKWLLAASVGC